MTAQAPTAITLRDLANITMEKGGHTQRDLAKAIGYSQGTISAWLSDKYPARTKKVDIAVAAWLRKQGTAVRPDDVSDTYFETRPSAAVIAACTAAQEEGAIAAIIGAPGLGKTIGIRQWTAWARREDVRHILVTADVATSAAAIIRRIAVALGVRAKSTMAMLLELIVEKLNREPSVIIIDEAQHLGVRALEAVRSIHDATQTGIVFAGSLALLRTLEEGDGAALELAQLQDRITLHERLVPLTPIECLGFARKYLGVDITDELALAELARISRGIPRRLVHLLDMCRRISGGKPLSIGMVREATKRMVNA